MTRNAKQTTTPRAELDTPEPVKIETKAGTLYLTIHDGESIHLTASRYENGHSVGALTINGVEYDASARLVWNPADVFFPDDYPERTAGKLAAGKGWRVEPPTRDESWESRKKVWSWGGYRPGLHIYRRAWPQHGPREATDAAKAKAIELFEKAANEWANGPGAAEAQRQGAIRAAHNEAANIEEQIAKLEEQIAEKRAKVAELDAQIAKLAKATP